MKAITILSIILLYSTTLFAQSDTILSHIEIVEMPGQTKDALFVKARQWYNEMFRDSKNVLTINDKETGELSGKGYSKINVAKSKGMMSSTYDMMFSVNVIVKDGKYKFEFTDMDVSRQLSTREKKELGILTSAASKENRTGYMMISQKSIDAHYAQIKIAAMQKAKDLADIFRARMAQKDKTDF